MPRKTANSYLYFTRKERRGSLLLLFVVLLLCLIPFLYPLLLNKKITSTPALDSALVNLKIKQADASQKKYAQNQEEKPYRQYDYPSSASYTSKKNEGVLFNFDPNTISAEGWKKLGLRDKTIATILNYRSKGGKFKQPDDIKKIWGLFPDEAERLLPYVQIAATNISVAPGNNYVAYNDKKFTESKKSFSKIDINAADTSAWIALPGIGSKLSQRIINFREKLGGFYSIQQVGETFGLPDSTFQKIKPFIQLTGEVKKININTATVDELKMHPYIRYHLANAIVQYRTQHGDYKLVEDIKKIMIVDEAAYTKMAPYLKTE